MLKFVHKRKTKTFVCLAESCPLSSTTFPHVLPLLSLLEKSVAVGEATEPWETMEVGMDVVMFHLGAARTIAQLGGIYCSNAESKLQGTGEQSLISVCQRRITYIHALKRKFSLFDSKGLT